MAVEELCERDRCASESFPGRCAPGYGYCLSLTGHDVSQSSDLCKKGSESYHEKDTVRLGDSQCKRGVIAANLSREGHSQTTGSVSNVNE